MCSLSEGEFINMKQEVVVMKRMRCPRGRDTSKNLTLNELLEIFHNTERGKEKMLEADPQTDARARSVQTDLGLLQ